MVLDIHCSRETEFDGKIPLVLKHAAWNTWIYIFALHPGEVEATVYWLFV